MCYHRYIHFLLVEPMENQTKPGFLSTMSPVQVFIFGVVEAILVLCTIGFFIMLGVYFNADTSDDNDTDTPIVVNNGAQNPTGDTQPTKITVAPVDEKVDHIRGNKDAKVTLVEYSDLECPFCKKFHPTMQQIMDKYGKDVRWVYRHFPLDSLHSQARPEAIASECAGEQGKFWEFVDKIYEITPGNDGIDMTKLGEYAKEVGVKNISKFQSCVDEKKFADRVQRDSSSGEAAGVRGTPNTIIVGPNGDTVVVNGAEPFSSVEAKLLQFLK